MEIYHGTWVPSDGKEFENPGQFIFWVETSAPVPGKPQAGHHPCSLREERKLNSLLTADLGFAKSIVSSVRAQPSSFQARLPSAKGKPLPSLEMAQLVGVYLPDDVNWNNWTIRGVAIERPLIFLRELQFRASFGGPDFVLGHDLKFWIQYTQHLRNLIRQHQFLPVMKCQKTGRKKSDMRIMAGWSPAAGMYERGIAEFAEAMPAVCRAVADVSAKRGSGGTLALLDPDTLLRNYSERQVETLVRNTDFPQTFLSKQKDGWFVAALDSGLISGFGEWTPEKLPSVEDWKRWRSWNKRILGQSREAGFVLGLRLQQQEGKQESEWRIDLFVSAAADPSLSIDLAEWWSLPDVEQDLWLRQFGRQFERNLLISLGHAARMCPLLWQGLENSRPTGVDVDLETAYEFLKNDALVLESAGFRIMLPSWWTPTGRRRARVRIKASGQSSSGSSQSASPGLFDLSSIVNYDYELSVDGEPVSEEEWLELVNAKSPLVKFRGEWMEIDKLQLNKMLEMWRQQGDVENAISLDQFLKDVAEADESNIEYSFDESLGDIVRGLQQQEVIQPLEDPAGLNGQLRAYQKKGLAWLARQQELGLNSCLADDMGLGKTIQLIALLLEERKGMNAEEKAGLQPTLLVAPTSVLSNWQKETQKFAPELKCVIHHGSDRSSTPEAFDEFVSASDLVVTSFTLARSDAGLLKNREWRRIVVDEAQNIKNPKSGQTRAICSLNAPRRIAMTGTPVENRLMDLWSLFNFLNPGYLGSQTQFRRAYESPIQRDNDRTRLELLQRLVRPFILRRLKTDKSIISDLPDKVEQKVYCNLTREQASLYQAVVDDVEQQLEEAEGMQRRGLMLSTLMKLKQICNHPSQFLQDGSSFDESRSHKLTRLNEMVDEALNESDSLLVFTQFTEIGGRLEGLLRERHGCPVHYLHGGTSRTRREKMIESFQDPDSPPGIFILSLRAGGVGITLTQANHVFHFDRWWNPAVENQATDRAYRIGQEKTVFAHKMVTLGTLEERIDEMIEQKLALAQNIVGTDESWITEMDNESFGELISLNRKTIMEAA